MTSFTKFVAIAVQSTGVLAVGHFGMVDLVNNDPAVNPLSIAVEKFTCCPEGQFYDRNGEYGDDGKKICREFWAHNKRRFQGNDAEFAERNFPSVREARGHVWEQMEKLHHLAVHFLQCSRYEDEDTCRGHDKDNVKCEWSGEGSFPSPCGPTNHPLETSEPVRAYTDDLGHLGAGGDSNGYEYIMMGILHQVDDCNIGSNPWNARCAQVFEEHDFARAVLSTLSEKIAILENLGDCYCDREGATNCRQLNRRRLLSNSVDKQ